MARELIKFKSCLDFWGGINKGVKYYIIVDGTKETAEIFELYNKKYQKTKNNRFILEGCEIDFDFENIWS